MAVTQVLHSSSPSQAQPFVTAMPLKLKRVQTKEEFDPVVIVEHEAYSQPANSFWEILKGPSIEECQDRQWNWHTIDPKSNWFYVHDTESDEAVGGAQWIVNETDPFEQPAPALRATWWENSRSSLAVEFFKLMSAQATSRTWQIKRSSTSSPVDRNA